MALEPDRHREIIPTSYFATGNGGNGRNEGGNGRNGRNEKMEEIVAETASRIFTLVMIHFVSVLWIQAVNYHRQIHSINSTKDTA